MTFRQTFDKEESWQKKAIIVQTCHLTRKLQHKKWRMEDTAEELGISKSHVSEDLKLAEAINNNEQIKEFSRNGALKLI